MDIKYLAWVLKDHPGFGPEGPPLQETPAITTVFDRVEQRNHYLKMKSNHS